MHAWIANRSTDGVQTAKERLHAAEKHFKQQEYGPCLLDLALLDRQLDDAEDVPLVDLVRQRAVVQMHLDGRRQQWEKVIAGTLHKALLMVTRVWP